MITSFAHTLTSKKNFSELINKLLNNIEEHAFKVLHIHDVQATFAGKNISHGPYKIIEFCQAPSAKIVLDIDATIGLFLPCRFIVYELNGTVYIKAMRPTIIREYFPNADLGDLPERIDNEIATIISSL